MSSADIYISTELNASCDPSLTLIRSYSLLKTVLFCRAYETLPQHLRDSLGSEDCSVHTNVLNYLYQ